LKNEVVVITGASAGLGRATAREFGRRGAKVGLIARGVDGLQAAKQEIEAAGGSAMVLRLDVAAAKAAEGAAASIEQEFGAIDVWVNNAMTSVFSPVKEMQPEEHKRVTEVTYLGVVYGTLAALKRCCGAIVEPSFRSDRLWFIAVSRFNQLIALQARDCRIYGFLAL
jgi:NADP-dependent 3-hydroxy acid dehydrogenase YdfG